MSSIPHLSSVPEEVVDSVGYAIDDLIEQHQLTPPEIIAAVLAHFESITHDIGGNIDHPDEISDLEAMLTDVRSKLEC